MGAINFGTLTNISRLALVNKPETEQYFYNYELEETQEELDKLNLYYFNLSIKYGYYEGFYIVLGYENIPYIYNNSQEKAETIKQIKRIIKALKEETKETYTSRTYKNKSFDEILKEYEINNKRRIQELREG